MRSLSYLKIFNEERDYLLKNLKSDYIPNTLYYWQRLFSFLKYKEKACRFFWLLNIYKRRVVIRKILASTYIRSTAYKIHKCSRTLWRRKVILNERKDLKSIKQKKYVSIRKNRISSQHERIKIFLEMEEKIQKFVKNKRKRRRRKKFRLDTGNNWTIFR